MRDKAGCLNCHFFCKFIPMLSTTERNPILDEFRNMAGFLKLIEDNSHTYECFHGNWNIRNTDKENIAEIKRIILRKDRGSNCLLFSVYDKDATLEAVMQGNKRKEEVIDRKTTRRIACGRLSFYLRPSGLSDLVGKTDATFLLLPFLNFLILLSHYPESKYYNRIVWKNS